MSVADYIELNMTLVEAEGQEEWMQHEEVDDTAIMGELRSVLIYCDSLHLIIGFSADEKNEIYPNPYCGERNNQESGVVMDPDSCNKD